MLNFGGVAIVTWIYTSPTISHELAWMRDCDDMDNLQAKFGQLQRRWEMTEAKQWLFFEADPVSNASRAQLLGHPLANAKLLQLFLVVTFDILT